MNDEVQDHGDLRAEIRVAIDELRAARAEIAYLRKDLSVKDEYIEYLKRQLAERPE